MNFYNRYDFLEFFDKEEILEKDADISRYTIVIKTDLLFTLYISSYAQYAIIGLKCKNIEYPIFDIGIHELT